MPLSGTVCCQTGQKTDFQQCLDQCRGRGCVYPLPLIVSMAKNTEKRSSAGISATTILQCPRQTIMKEEIDYYEAPSEYHARWRGTGVHAMAEADGPYPGVIQEIRIRKTITVDGIDIEITGQPDWYDTTSNHLDDWKSTGKCPTKPYDDHKAQVNIYAWLIDGGTWDNGEKSDTIVESASIVYIDPSRSLIHPIDLWSSGATDAFIRRKIEPLVRHRKHGVYPTVADLASSDKWKIRYCPFSGTGHCCGDE